MHLLSEKYGEVKNLRTAWFDLARALLSDSKDYEQAISYLHKATEEEGDFPANWEIQLLMAQAFEQIEGRKVDAVQAYLSSLNGIESNNYGTILQAAHDHLTPNDASSISKWVEEDWLPLQKLDQLNSDNKILVWLLMARINLYRYQFTDAIDYFQKILTIDPQHSAALEGLGSTMEQHGEYDTASEYYRKAMASNHQNKDLLRLKLINTLVERNSFSEALVEIQEAQSQDLSASEMVRLNTLFAKCKLGQGEVESSFAETEKILTQLDDPALQIPIRSQVDVYEISATSLLSLQKYEEANTQLEKGLILEPRNHSLLFLKAQILIESQADFEEGRKLLRLVKRGGHIVVQEKIDQILLHRDHDVNAHLFIAFVLLEFDFPKENIEAQFIVLKDGGDLKSNNNIKGPDAYKEIGLYVLKANYFAKQKEEEQAAINFYKAARRYNWQGAVDIGRFYFSELEKWIQNKEFDWKKALEIDPDFIKYHWVAADLKSQESSITVPPYHDEKKVEEAYQLWHASQIKPIYEKVDFWAYQVIALIHESRFKFAQEKNVNEYWWALTYMERALIIKDDSDWNWNFLGKCYNSLSLHHNSLELLRRGKGIQSSAWNTEETCTTYLDMGNFDQGEPYIAGLIDQAATPELEVRFQSFQAYIDLHRGKFENLKEQFDQDIKFFPNDIWGYYMKMATCFKIGDFEEAQLVAQIIWELRKDLKSYPTSLTSFAWAGFLLGEYDEAKTFYEETNRLANEPSFSVGLAFVYIMKEDLAMAEKNFQYLIQNEKNKRELNWIKSDLSALGKFVKTKNISDQTEIDTFIETWLEKISKREKELMEREVDLYLELEERMEYLESIGIENGDIAWVALQSGLARVAWYEDDLEKAHTYYKRLLPYQEKFPEAGLMLEKVEESLIDRNKAKILYEKGNVDLRDLEEIDFQNPAIAIKKEILQYRFYAEKGNKQSSKKHLLSAIEQAKGNKDLQTILTNEFQQNLTDAKSFWNVDGELTALIAEAKTKEEKLGYAELKKSIHGYWDQYLNTSGTNDLFAVVTPIAIEISADLVPQESDAEEWPVFKKYIPAMRAELKEQFGLGIPGVRIRANEGDMPPRSYIIMIDEIPLVMGYVEVNSCYVQKTVEELGVLGIPAKEQINPKNNLNGSWVAKEYQTVLDENNIEYRADYFQYMMEHLVAVLYTHLPLYIDVDRSVAYLYYEKENWSTTALENSKRIVNDDQSLLRFTKVLQDLVQEQVPIKAKEKIVNTFYALQNDYSDPNVLLAQMRLQLKAFLPGNAPLLEKLYLPIEIEEKIKEEFQVVNDQHFLAMKPENCQDVLAELRSFLDPYPKHWNYALVVSETNLRGHIRKLISLEFPKLTIIAKEEINESYV